MRLTITQPDDWHLHLRDGAHLESVVAHSVDQFARAIVMPNLRPPVATVAEALAYRERILAASPRPWDPMMTLYLTPQTSVADVRAAAESPHVKAIKLYPAGATTNSEAGVVSLDGLAPIFEEMSARKVPLLVHGESTERSVDVFDREARFIDDVLAPLVDRFPALKVVFEHVTTAQAVDFVMQAGSNVAATITAHHLLYNRNALFAGGLRPDYYCLPVLKREEHRHALLAAATRGNRSFFLGTDSAPHERNQKHTGCGCAGIYTAHAALPLYAEAFESVDRLDRLEAFASFHGPDFYGLPRNTSTLTLEKAPWRVPESYRFGEGVVTPLRAGQELAWRVAVDR